MLARCHAVDVIVPIVRKERKARLGKAPRVPNGTPGIKPGKIEE